MLAILNQVRNYSLKETTPLSLKTIYNYGKNINKKRIIKQSQYLYEEVPIRIAKRIVNLQTLPYNLCKMKGLQSIHDDYITTFETLLSHKYPTNLNQCLEFKTTLEELHKKHKNVEFNFANVLKSYKNTNHQEMLLNEKTINYQLKEFYLSRISLRLLINQHIEVMNENIGENNVGMIYIFNPEEVINKAIKEANRVLDQKYIDIPDINLQIINSKKIMYIPRYLHYIIFEILKNSMEATINNHSSNLPPIDIICVNYNDQLSIKISDKGGGFPKDNINQIFSFFYSTIQDHEHDPYNIKIPISGFGHGLGLSKLYANYFGGKLHVIPMQGIGTDTFIHLNSLGENSEIFLESMADNIA
ncbi:Mitochondrial branched-chain alpha-ketoacid dehydrogenase kinase [seawater metagenome]|uniref:[pyruvate dehydrogenase (acetyl-transferring)] kinase n=1 Tax=seawater metagenome TaxID=1561972 RepID=A0A5E8CKP1_9ZZZZ